MRCREGREFRESEVKGKCRRQIGESEVRERGRERGKILNCLSVSGSARGREREGRKEEEEENGN